MRIAKANPNVPGFSGPLSTSSVRMRKNLKIYTDERHDYAGEDSKFTVIFAHVWNGIQIRGQRT